MKRISLYISLIFIISIAVHPIASQALEIGKDSAKSSSKIQIGGGVGAMIYAALGSKTVSTPLYRIEFEINSFKIGGTGGAEVLYYPSETHSFSVGIFYEQRKIDVKIMDLKTMIPLTIIPISPFFGFSPFSLMSLPYEKFFSTTAVSTHYLNIPLSYRFHPSAYFYIGLGLDIAVLMKAQADFKILIISSSLDLKQYFRAVDLGARVLVGATYNGIYLEYSAGIGLMDLDSFGGTRRSIYMKLIAGYRF